MAPGEPAIELVADFYIALAAVDSAAALSGAVVGSGGGGGTSTGGSVSPSSVVGSQPGHSSSSRALLMGRLMALSCGVTGMDQ